VKELKQAFPSESVHENTELLMKVIEEMKKCSSSQQLPQLQQSSYNPSAAPYPAAASTPVNYEGMNVNSFSNSNLSVIKKQQKANKPRSLPQLENDPMTKISQSNSNRNKSQPPDDFDE
jgi:hypothetical protein